MTNRGRKQRI